MVHILEAFGNVTEFSSILAIILGTLWGIIVGAMPGMGSSLAITICLSFTYTMPPVAAIGLLLGVYCGSVYGGSISAILINTPGTPQSAATTLDGFPMANKGKAAEALGWGTVSSTVGGLFSCVVLIIIGPQLAKVAMKFGPIEMFALICMALTCIVAVSEGSMLKGFLSGIIGLTLATVGIDPINGESRFDLGLLDLTSGINLIAAIVGLFALSEVFSRAKASSVQKKQTIVYSGIKMPPLSAWKGRIGGLMRSCAIGSGVGILPGVGATVAAFISYATAKKSSPHKENFGKGEPDGIIASEAANNAVTGGALVPSLALGLPGDGIMAIMLATLIIHGITPGPRLLVDNPVEVYAVFMALILANIAMFLFSFPVSRLFAYMLRLPEPLLMGMVIILCFLGTYGVRNSIFDLYVTIVMGVLGFILRYYKVPLPPLAIGFVLGPQLELFLSQGILLTRGDFSRFLTDSPIAVGLFIITIGILLYPIVKHFIKLSNKETNNG